MFISFFVFPLIANNWLTNGQNLTSFQWTYLLFYLLIYMYAYVYIYIYVYIYGYLYIYIYMYLFLLQSRGFQFDWLVLIWLGWSGLSLTRFGVVSVRFAFKLTELRVHVSSSTWMRKSKRERDRERDRKRKRGLGKEQELLRCSAFFMCVCVSVITRLLVYMHLLPYSPAHIWIDE